MGGLEDLLNKIHHDHAEFRVRTERESSALRRRVEKLELEMAFSKEKELKEG